MKVKNSILVPLFEQLTKLSDPKYSFGYKAIKAIIKNKTKLAEDIKEKASIQQQLEVTKTGEELNLAVSQLLSDESEIELLPLPVSDLKLVGDGGPNAIDLEVLQFFDFAGLILWE